MTWFTACDWSCEALTLQKIHGGVETERRERGRESEGERGREGQREVGRERQRDIQRQKHIKERGPDRQR